MRELFTRIKLLIIPLLLMCMTTGCFATYTLTDTTEYVEYYSENVTTTPIEDSFTQEEKQDSNVINEDESYSSKEDVAEYIHVYGKLPKNFMTKKEARELGWEGGSLEDFATGKCIGGDRFGNYEQLLPEEEGRVYYECDIDTLGADSRGAKRIVFSNDGLIFYTEDHYESFEQLY